MRNDAVSRLTRMALCTAVLCTVAPLSLPIGPVSLTLGVFGVLLCGALLPPDQALLATTAYLLLGLAGLPVFAGFSSGAAALLGPTGGFLLGFLASALVYWGVTAKWGKSLPGMALAMGLGLVVCYAFGTVWFLLVYTGGGSAATLLGALTLCVFPYILPDLGKIVLALVLTRRVGKYVRG